MALSQRLLVTLVVTCAAWIGWQSSSAAPAGIASDRFDAAGHAQPGDTTRPASADVPAPSPAPAALPPVDEQPLQDFADWARKLPAPAPGAAPGFTTALSEAQRQHAVTLAKARSATLLQLMRQAPQRVLDHALSYELRRKLPPELAGQVDTLVSGEGVLRAIIARNDEGSAALKACVLELNGATYLAHLGPRRRANLARLVNKPIPVWGIAVDGQMAVSDDPARLLSPAELQDHLASLATTPAATASAGAPTTPGSAPAPTPAGAVPADKSTPRPAPGIAGPVAPPESAKVFGLDLNPNACPITSQPITTTKAAAQVGTRIVYLCHSGHIVAVNERLVLAETDPSLAGDTGGGEVATDLPIAASSWSQGTKTALMIRVRFKDQYDSNNTYEPQTVSSCESTMAGTHTFFQDNSWQTMGLVGILNPDKKTDVTPVYTLPQTAQWYSDNDTSGYAYNVLSDARAIAANPSRGGNTSDPLYHPANASLQAYSYSTYNLEIVRYNGGPGSFSGQAYVGGRGCWMKSSSTGVMAHELGHNLGLWHANYWSVSTEDPIGPGSNSEYGDSFDTMGAASAGSNYFNTNFKNILDWLPDNNVIATDRSGVYRIYRQDTPSSDPTKAYALRIRKDSDRDYWGEYRQRFTSYPAFMNGLGLRWDRWAKSESGSHLLDLTPGTPDGKNDSPVVIGKTFSDRTASIHITPLRKGGADPYQWIDVAVNLGDFPSNQPPTIALSASATATGTAGPITFNALASDPDGDDLAYAWDIDFVNTADRKLPGNVTSVTHSWATPGQYVVRCTVSDMKGGSASDSVLVTIGSPTTVFTIAGRVLDSGGQPVAGVRVHNGLTGTSYRGDYTDSLGRYRITNLPAGSYSLAAAQPGATIAPANFANPQSVGPDRADRDFLYTLKPAVAVAALNASISENGGTGVFRFTRTGSLASALTVSFDLSGSAYFTSDYTLSPTPSGTSNPRSLTIPAGVATYDLTVTAVNNTYAESDARIDLVLVESASYAIAPPGMASMGIVDDDRNCHVSVAATDNLATENAGNNALFTISRTGVINKSATVYFVLEGTSIKGTDYTSVSTSVTLAVNQASATVSIAPIDDAIPEADETVTLRITSVSGTTIGATLNNTATAVIRDNDTLVSLETLDDAANETGDTGSFRVTRLGSTDLPLTVHYTVSPASTATPGTDYVALPGTITIPAGDSSAVITINPLNDVVQEGNESVIVSLDSSSDYAVDDLNTGTVTIIDDETPVLSVIANDPAAAEPDNHGQFTITRAGPTASALTVNYTLTGSATSGADYIAIPLSVNIPAGETSLVVPITLLDDTLGEYDETVVLTLTPAAGYNVGSPASATITITDNDTSVTISATDNSATEGADSGRFTVTRQGSTANPLVVNYTLSGSAANTDDYATLSGTVTIAAGATTATFDVVPVDDSVSENVETVVATIVAGSGYLPGSPASATVSLYDNDPVVVIVGVSDSTCAESSSNDGVFTVTRLGLRSSAVTVSYALSGSATNGADYATLSGSVTISSNANTASITVNPTDDSAYEGPETVVVTLTGSSLGTVGEPASDTITLTDNDKPTISITAADDTAAEPGDDTAYFLVSRSGITSLQAVTVLYTVSGSATAGLTAGDYERLSGSVTIPLNEATAVIPVTAFDDAIVEPAETVTVTLSTHTSYNVAASPANAATVTILDNEPTNVITISASDNSASEPGQGSSTGKWTITRAGSPASEIIVNLKTGGSATSGSDYLAIPASVTIPAGATSATVTLTPIDDTDLESDESVTLYLLPGNDYTLGHPSSASINLYDDEPATVYLSLADSTAIEQSSVDTGKFRFNRRGLRNAALSINYTITGTATPGTDFNPLNSPYSLGSNSTGGDLTLTPVNDALVEGPETVILTLAPGSNYAIGSPDSITLVIRDDEVPTVTVSVTDSSAKEPADTGSYRVSRTGATTSPLTVNYTLAGTAESGVDYLGLSGVATIPAGSANTTITASPVDDALPEGTETILLTLAANGSAYNLGTTSANLINLGDDDVPTVSITASDANAAEAGLDPGEFTFTRTGSTVGSLTVLYSVSGSATSAADYATLPASITIPDGQASAVLPVNPFDDSINEGSEAVTLNLIANPAYSFTTTSGTTVNIADNDKPTATIVALDENASEAPAPGGSTPDTGRFMLVLSNTSTSNITLNLTVAGTATPSTDYTALPSTLKINNGSLTGTLTVTPIDDAETETTETVQLSLATGSTYNIGLPSTAAVTIADNDQPPASISVAAIDAFATESPVPVTDTAKFRLYRTVNTSDELTVYFSLTGSAVNGADYLTLPDSATFVANQTQFNLTVTPIDDPVYEGDESVTLTLLPGAGYSLAPASTADATILDDDPIPQPPHVITRLPFYNASAFDGNGASVADADDNAIASDKTALLPGQTASFANYTSYTRGLNGIVIDIDDAPGTPTLADFEFARGNDNNPDAWAPVPAPSAFVVRPDAGVGGSTRIMIAWPDNTIANQWLKVTVKANPLTTGLLANDVFFLGNAPADAGNSPANAIVNATDQLAPRNNPLDPAPITNAHDYNRDAKVDAADETAARVNATNFRNALKLIAVP